MQDFAGKVAVVTGAAHGIGRGLAERCAHEGMDVVVADLELRPAEKVAAGIRATGRRALALEVDVSEREQVFSLAERVYEEFGAAHLLFNNADVSMHAKIADSKPSDWEWILAVNLWGPLNGVHAFLPRMQAQEGEAHIVNTASMSGLISRPNQRGIYQTVKFGVVAMTNALRIELKQDGSNVSASCFCPGGVLTDIEDAGRHRQGRFGGPVTLGKHPVPRQSNPMLPEQVAARVLEGVREDRQYIFSHPQTRPQVEEQYRQILDDFDAAQAIVDRVG